MPLEDLVHELGGRGASVLLGLVLGGAIGLLAARWKRMRERRRILAGDARDTVVIQHHVLEPCGATYAMRIRSLGQGALARVVPNGHLAGEFLRRAWQVTPHDTLISMDGAEGSYLLETLTNFVCDRAANASFEHDLYVMAPCCEPAALAQHQPITILLIAVADLARFEEWMGCRHFMVEHSSDGARILTLMELAQRFRREQQHVAELRSAGKRTQFAETMYILDLALDRRSAAIPVKPVPWGRYETVLKQLDLE